MRKATIITPPPLFPLAVNVTVVTFAVEPPSVDTDQRLGHLPAERSVLSGLDTWSCSATGIIHHVGPRVSPAAGDNLHPRAAE